MNGRKLKRDLVFFTPGKPGAVFIYNAGLMMSRDQLNLIVDHLEYDTQNTIRWVEERRAIPRRMEA